MIAMLEHECVQRKGWITAEELMEITVIAESTPGPISINCATYTGYRRAGFWGAVAATVGITLPGALLFFSIALFFEEFLSIPVVFHIFQGIRVAVALLIVRAAFRMLKSMMKQSTEKRTAGCIVAVFFAVAFVAGLLGGRIPTIYLILTGGLAGFFFYGFSGKEKDVKEKNDIS